MYVCVHSPPTHGLWPMPRPHYFFSFTGLPVASAVADVPSDHPNQSHFILSCSWWPPPRSPAPYGVSAGRWSLSPLALGDQQGPPHVPSRVFIGTVRTTLLAPQPLRDQPPPPTA
eukprot:GGOE01033405.1.p3 GENE.GGOE01033405.1~~GGOE01033405.1.p3  ORF type:complete len:115 (-),score=2.54 GGOE01033405.1:880-1224(-)